MKNKVNILVLIFSFIILYPCLTGAKKSLNPVHRRPVRTKTLPESLEDTLGFGLSMESFNYDKGIIALSDMNVACVFNLNTNKLTKFSDRFNQFAALDIDNGGNSIALLYGSIVFGGGGKFKFKVVCLNSNSTIYRDEIGASNCSKVVFHKKSDAFIFISSHGVLVLSLKEKSLNKISYREDIINCADFHPRDYKVIGGCDDGVVGYWDLGGNCLSSMDIHEGRVRVVKFNEAGNRVLSGGEDKKLNLSCLKTEQVVQSFVGHEGEVRALSFGPHDRFVISSDSKKIVRIWNISDGSCVRNLGEVGIGYFFNKKEIVSFNVKFSPNRTVFKFWDIPRSKFLKDFYKKLGSRLSYCDVRIFIELDEDEIKEFEEEAERQKEMGA